MQLMTSAALALFGVAETVCAPDIGKHFEGTQGAFVLYDLGRGQFTRLNEPRCRERFSPFSTFKIPNSLIGLETGAVADAGTVIAWDRVKYPLPSLTKEPFVQWARDHTLQSAFTNSVVWYYRELAQRVGEVKMKRYVDAFHYGNADISGGLNSRELFDAFWLESSLTISASEQVEFLKAFYTGKLPVSERATRIVKEIMVRERGDGWILSGKTGGGSVGPGRSLGWFVGYLERGGDVYIFATNIDGPSFQSIREKRIDVTKGILRALGLLP